LGYFPCSLAYPYVGTQLPEADRTRVRQFGSGATLRPKVQAETVKAEPHFNHAGGVIVLAEQEKST
jgi:hypothetical protein